jgi:hypothetical protein
MRWCTKLSQGGLDWPTAIRPVVDNQLVDQFRSLPLTENRSLSKLASACRWWPISKPRYQIRWVRWPTGIHLRPSSCPQVGCLGCVEAHLAPHFCQLILAPDARQKRLTIIFTIWNPSRNSAGLLAKDWLQIVVLLCLKHYTKYHFLFLISYQVFVQMIRLKFNLKDLSIMYTHMYI